MVSLQINNLIKIIISVFVIVVVVAGFGLFFKDYVITFFKNLFGVEAPTLFLSLFK